MNVEFLLAAALAVSPGFEDLEADAEARIERVKAQLEELRVNRHIPGVSVAVVHEGRIEWAAGFGVLRKGESAKVDEETLFQAASISKPVAAVAALRLVDRGEIDLDRDVNEYLFSWELPKPSIATDKEVTLRRILSHTAGLTVHGFPGYFSDETAPELLDLLDGKAPSNTAAIRVDLAPETRFRYSGGGYCILQQLLLDGAEGEFPALMDELVLAPLGMTRSTYSQPLKQEWRANAANGHAFPPLQPLRGDGFVTHPEMAAAGLWTTPSDLARFFIAIQEACAGRSEKFLKPETARAFVTAQPATISEQNGGTGVGIGIFLEGTPAHPRFTHGGSNRGFRCVFQAYRDDGLGAAVMTNGDHGGAFLDPALDLIAREYAWPDWKPSGP